jgi:hypothetical protein
MNKARCGAPRMNVSGMATCMETWHGDMAWRQTADVGSVGFLGSGELLSSRFSAVS